MYLLTQQWARYPALLYGISLLIGVSYRFSLSVWLGLPAFLLWSPLALYKRSWGRLVLSLLTCLCGYAIALTLEGLPTLPLKGVEGEGEFEIHSLTLSSHHFGQSWQYKGRLSIFKDEAGNILGWNIPVTIHLPYKKEITHPPANCCYVMKGRLKRTRKGSYAFIVLLDIPWYPLEKTWSLAEMRYNAKQVVKRYIHTQTTSERAAKFLTGLATGEFDDRMMAYEFNRFGLQHLMAISGFHFGIIAYFFSLNASLLFPRKWVPWALIAGLTAYFLFLGPSASVMRAWISAILFFGGQLFEREGTGLNSLGLGLIGILTFDPLASLQLGFQFSFASTAGILLFHSPSLHLLEKIWPKRRVDAILKMSFLNQHAYLILSFIKQGVALTLAVTIIALPMTLWYFHSFALLSLFYNLFFPFLVSVAMFLLMLGTFLAWIPPLSSLIHALNGSYTEGVLNFTYSVPTHYDITFYSYTLTVEFLIVYLSAIFFTGLWLKSRSLNFSEWRYPL